MNKRLTDDELRQTAHVLLVDLSVPHGTAVRERLLKIVTLREALALVMEEIEPPLQPSAMIKCADKTWHFNEIKAAYQMMPGQAKR